MPITQTCVTLSRISISWAYRTILQGCTRHSHADHVATKQIAGQLSGVHMVYVMSTQYTHGAHFVTKLST